MCETNRVGKGKKSNGRQEEFVPLFLAALIGISGNSEKRVAVWPKIKGDSFVRTDVKGELLLWFSFGREQE